MTLTVSDMLDNAACASQRQELLNDPVVRGALVRSFAQWIQCREDYDPEKQGDAVYDLQNSFEATY